MIYLTVFILLLYYIYKYDIQKNKRFKNTIFWGLCIVFILLAGLRYRIGGDTLGYMEFWNRYPNFWDFNWMSDIEKTKQSYPNMERYQPGWFIFVMFFLGICKHHLMMQIAVAIILNYSIFRTIKKYSPYPFITIFIYYFNFKFLELEFEIMRESVAISFYLLFAYDNFVKRKWGKYYIGTFLAYMIHPSALFMLFLPLLRNLKLSLFKGTLIFVILPITISILGRIILGDLINIILDADNYTSSYIASSVDMKYNSSYIAMYIYQPLVIYFFMAFLYKRINNTFYAPLIFVYLFFLNLCLLYFTASRLVDYIMIPVYIGLTPLFFSIIKRYKTLLVLPVLLLVYNVPTLIAFKLNPEKPSLYFPYQDFIFQERSSAQKIIDRNFELGK